MQITINENHIATHAATWNDGMDWMYSIFIA